MNDQMPELTVGGAGAVPLEAPSLGSECMGVCICVWVGGSGGGVRSVL